jgi:transposase-like protein
LKWSGRKLIGEDQDLICGIVQLAMQLFLEAEMDEALGASKGECTEDRLGHRWSLPSQAHLWMAYSSIFRLK